MGPGALVEPSHVLALVLAASGGAGALLAGVWLGFRVTTRDASLLARFAVEAKEARLLGELTASQQKALREEWETFSESIERRRKSIGTAAARAERAAATAAAEPVLPAAAVPQSINDRRRAVARRMNGRV